MLSFAVGLERGVVGAYHGAVSVFGDREFARGAAEILGNEAMRRAVFWPALGQNPLPDASVT